jgi:site-specific recombinase XerD
VFLNLDGTPLIEHGLKLAIRRLAHSSGIKRLHATCYAITFAVNFLVNGGDLFTLQQTLGHTTLEMIWRYVNLASSHVMV